MKLVKFMSLLVLAYTAVSNYTIFDKEAQFAFAWLGFGLILAVCYSPVIIYFYKIGKFLKKLEAI